MRDKAGEVVHRSDTSLFQLVYVGTLSASKGLPFILEALKLSFLFLLCFFQAKLWIVAVLSGAFFVQAFLAMQPSADGAPPLLPVAPENRMRLWRLWLVLYVLLMLAFPVGMIGAAALLLALVLVTPFALDDEKSLDVEKMNLDIPDPQAVETTIAPEPEPAAEKPAHGDVVVAGSGKSPSTGAANLEGEAAKEKASDAKAKPAEETKAPAKAEEAAKPAKPAEPARNEAAPTGEGYYIQVLATSSELSAEKLVKDMKLQGLPAYKMSVRQNGKTLWRVRVGLFKTKAEAESASGLLMLNNFASKPIVSHQKASKK